MNSSDAPPTKHRHVPPEIIEEILLNLRVKPLLRFSSVSKSWNTMILGSQFIKKNSSRAAALGRKRICMHHFAYNIPPSSFPLSAVSRPPSSTTVDSDAVLAFPFPGETSITAFCDELLCLETDKSLKLWNPSMGEHFDILKPSSPNDYVCRDGRRRRYEYVYGLGYDTAADDYKLMRVSLEEGSSPGAAELYSLRSNSWKEIVEPLRRDPPLLCRCSTGVFLGGALHWLFLDSCYATRLVINAFDLSTEEYRELALPPEFNKSGLAAGKQLTVLKGNLCLSLNYSMRNTNRFVLWMMEDYGVVESWTKKLEFDSNVPCFKMENARVMPVYLFEDGCYLIGLYGDGRLVLAHLEKQEEWVFLSKDEETRVIKHIGGYHRIFYVISEFFVYVKSLVSPAMWAGQCSIRLSRSDPT